MVAVAALTLLTGCQQAVNPTPPPLPTPTNTVAAWEPLLAPEEDAGTGDFAFDSATPFSGSIQLRLDTIAWVHEVVDGTDAFTHPYTHCTKSALHRPLAPTRAGLDDLPASEQLLSENLTRPLVEDARTGVWLSSPSFDIVHAIEADATTVRYVGVRAFTSADLELIITLSCPDSESFRQSYPGFRTSGMVIAHETPMASAASELIGPYQVHIPIDLGPGPHAMGTVQFDASGAPARYVVASDDEYSHIARRFGLFGIATPTAEPADGYNADTGYLTVLNQVRRSSTPWVLYAGDMLNLSAYTVTSVGSINGVVTSLPAPAPLPPQR